MFRLFLSEDGVFMGVADIKVSVVMPIYNESKYIAKCIESLLLQDYPSADMEWIFVDGCSTDNTKEIVSEYAKKYPNLIRLYDNPNKTVPYAMNIGIKVSSGKYIVRLDAHADYASDYISKCVYYLDTTDADNVGGVVETKARTKMGGRIALMLSSKFGVGNSNFRTNGDSGYVDTVPFGAFRREIFDKVGFYDERLTRNQDNEMNWRIRKNGGKIYLSNDIRLTYYCRDTMGGIARMAVQNGRWNVITMRLCPGSMGVRHFVPLVFLLSLIFMPVLSCVWYPFALLFAAEGFLYALLDVLFSVKLALSAEGDNPLICLVMLLVLFPVFHICYGFGSFMGIFCLFGKNFRNEFINRKRNTEAATSQEAQEQIHSAVK